MSRLYLSESGRIIPELGEELTTYRRARKLLDLPASARPARVFCLAQSHGGNRLPLRAALNGIALAPVEPPPDGAWRGYQWLELAAPREALRPGQNVLEFWTDGAAMNTWALALEPGYAAPGSFASDDGGASWRNDHMSYLNVVRGDYVVRVRLAEGEDPAPPGMAWEAPEHPRLAHLRQIMPAAALGPAPLMQRVRALTAWISTSWEHTNSARGVQYAPWDAETILAWGQAKVGHNARRPIAMCVHYAVTFVTCCQAAGIPARCVISTHEINGGEGHFVAEVWFAEYGKWVLVDPNLDAVFYQDGAPLATAEVQAASDRLARLAVWGPGLDFQRQFAHIRAFINDNYLQGRWIKQYGIWPRTDFLAHPEWSPPGHGSAVYCETGIVWRADGPDASGMFPYRAGPAYFSAPPS